MSLPARLSISTNRAFATSSVLNRTDFLAKHRRLTGSDGQVNQALTKEDLQSQSLRQRR
ncbi:hypothetical protein BAUCODRAFT_39782 [Baudoinia panamericana UAMH 10762]|uniref:Uncharacterized protein n=1 Tax=Baudoinia panamericana (strain UAMH 10762) TaxID=717646 RepID=M2MWK9_BAUPA|nr:uncharacterized protein BAUCODRAFT_39782 [Baudoinia panamericana UAMH 10762]EMC90974.1 hypothetical protein BAUCODRAFT_39782 [Baudoinia panamericana UAMH 10762]